MVNLNFKKSIEVSKERSENNKSSEVGILIVDDEAINLRGISGLLEEKYKVYTANSGKEALEVLEKTSDIGVIISDHIMPEMTGVDLLIETNKKYPDITRIILTGFADLENVMNAVNKADIYRFIVKPIVPEHFISVIDSAASNYRDSIIKKHFIRQFKKIIYPHQLEKIKNLIDIQETMPTSEEEAAVIAFDVQDSSKIPEKERHEFLESVIRSCYQLMIGYYDPIKLAANAFMIKELGDGFLCSVGFPFKCDGNLSSTADSLVQGFKMIFDRHKSEILTDKDVNYSVGIAKGSIRGYFPKIGPKNYELFGEGIVKAVRYESMRKILLEKLDRPKSNIVIVEEIVYDEMEENFKKNYDKFPLDEIKVRDDADAKFLYYQIDPQ